MIGERSMISLYTGAGGMDYGFEAAGFNTRVALEFDRDAAASIRLNRSWPVIEADILDTGSAEILRTAELEVGEADLLIGGPPCQPFSKAGYWSNGDTKRLADPRARTLDEYMRVVRDTLPRVFVLENVHGISYDGKEDGLILLERLLEEINEEQGTSYVPTWQVLNAAEYGVPQTRKRFFMVASRDGQPFRFPLPTHYGASGKVDSAQEGTPVLEPAITAWDAIGGLVPSTNEDLAVRGRWGALLPSIPEGENYLWHTSRGGGLPLFGWRRRYWSFLLKLSKSRPSWTIQAQPGPAIGPFHWENRRLSVMELARLQTFPHDVRFVGSRNSVQRQLGNAVPSLLAEVLGRAIQEQYFGQPRSHLQLSVQPQATTPPPEPISGVPPTYLHLLGEYEPHPGTGQGFGKTKASRAGSIGPTLLQSQD